MSPAIRHIKVKVKVNVDLYSAFAVITLLRRSGMARVLKGSHSFTCTPRVHPLTVWTIPAFAFAAEAGTHLPTPEGWKAELALKRSEYAETPVDLHATLTDAGGGMLLLITPLRIHPWRLVYRRCRYTHGDV